MGKIVIDMRKPTWRVEYQVGKGKNKYIAHTEEIDAKDKAMAAEHIGQRVEQLRDWRKVQPFVAPL